MSNSYSQYWTTFDPDYRYSPSVYINDHENLTLPQASPPLTGVVHVEDLQSFQHYDYPQSQATPETSILPYQSFPPGPLFTAPDDYPDANQQWYSRHLLHHNNNYNHVYPDFDGPSNQAIPSDDSFHSLINYSVPSQDQYNLHQFRAIDQPPIVTHRDFFQDVPSCETPLTQNCKTTMTARSRRKDATSPAPALGPIRTTRIRRRKVSPLQETQMNLTESYDLGTVGQDDSNNGSHQRLLRQIELEDHITRIKRRLSKLNIIYGEKLKEIYHDVFVPIIEQKYNFECPECLLEGETKRMESPYAFQRHWGSRHLSKTKFIPHDDQRLTELKEMLMCGVCCKKKVYCELYTVRRHVQSVHLKEMERELEDLKLEWFTA